MPIAVPLPIVAPLAPESVTEKALVILDARVAEHLDRDRLRRLARREGERARRERV